ncbi:MAG: glycoside hydrolase family 6 protein [Byssovorax sp.]
MNTRRIASSVSRSSLTALIVASLAPLGCVAATDEGVDDTGVEAEAITNDSFYTLKGVQSGKCVGVSSGSTNQGANVDQATCDGSSKQQWKLHAVSSGVFELVVKHSGLCMDVTAYSSNNGANIQQWPCDGSANKSWKVTSAGNGEYELAAQNSGKCLDVQDFATQNGGNLQQWSCGGGANQRFRLTQVGGAPPASGNPLAGSTFFVDPQNQAVAKEKETRAAGHSYDADLLKKISTHAQGEWIAEWSGDPKAAVSDIISRAGSAIPILVAYNIPNRDCGDYSAGGAPNAAAYRTWIDGFAAGIGNHKVAVVLEPDALSIWLDPSKSCSAVTPDLLAYAVKSLKSHPNAHVYIDAGTSRWNAFDKDAEALKKAGIYSADGFALNTSFTASTAETSAYGHKVSDALGGKVPFVIDTSRNAKGAPADSTWCNAWGRGLGTPSTASTGDARVHAFLWVKRPGQSDGSCNGGPSAGQWFQSMALDLAKNASF